MSSANDMRQGRLPYYRVRALRATLNRGNTLY
jgi:hypothetical protein